MYTFQIHSVLFWILCLLGLVALFATTRRASRPFRVYISFALLANASASVWILTDLLSPRGYAGLYHAVAVVSTALQAAVLWDVFTRFCRKTFDLRVAICAGISASFLGWFIWSGQAPGTFSVFSLTQFAVMHFAMYFAAGLALMLGQAKTDLSFLMVELSACVLVFTDVFSNYGLAAGQILFDLKYEIIRWAMQPTYLVGVVAALFLARSPGRLIIYKTSEEKA